MEKNSVFLCNTANLFDRLDSSDLVVCKHHRNQNCLRCDCFFKLIKLYNTILINIHHVDLALQYATRVIGIRAGRVVYDGPAGEVDGAVLDAIYQDRKEATA